MSTLTYDDLHTLFSYDPATGMFTRRVARGYRGCHRVGSTAGYISDTGYVVVMVDGNPYSAHRLAWFYMTGKWPDNQIDHVDGDRANNKWSNLREATNAQNAQNRREANVNNKSCGLLGVTWNARAAKWVAQIRVEGKNRGLGYFDSAEDAHTAYLTAKAKLHPFNTLGVPSDR